MKLARLSALTAAVALAATGCSLDSASNNADVVNVVVGYQSKTINTVTAGTLLRAQGYLERRLGDITANTAGDLGRPVGANAYAAIVRRGQGAMIVGIYRPRFRVANPKNDGVIRTWSRIRENNAEAVEFIQAIRAASGMEPFPMPTTKVKKPASTEAPDMEPPATTDTQDARAAQRAAQIEAIMEELAREKRVEPAYEKWED